MVVVCVCGGVSELVPAVITLMPALFKYLTLIGNIS